MTEKTQSVFLHNHLLAVAGGCSVAARVRTCCLLCILLLLPCAGFAPAPATTRSHPSPQILILHSYYLGYHWSDDIMEGIRSILRNSAVAHPQVEYMDVRRYPTAEHLRLLYAHYKEKFRDRKFDVIISSDNAALEFLLKHQEELFPQTPVIFCGVESLEQYNLSSRPLFTGVIEAIEDVPTVAVALKLHPKARRVVDITDYQRTLDAARSGTTNLEKTFPEMEFVFIDPRSLRMADLLERIKNYPADSTVGLLGAFFGNQYGETFTAEEATRVVSQNCPFPVYGINTPTFGHGIVGGKLNNGFFQGAEAARQALAVLSGTGPTGLPISSESPNRFQFDAVQLRRWQINRSLLPPGSLIANEPVSLYSEHKRVIWSVLGFLALQSVAICVLLMNMRRRKKAEAMLRGSEASLEEAQSIAHVGSWHHDFASHHLTWSDETYRIFGYVPEGAAVSFDFFIGRVHPEDRAAVIRAVKEARASGKPYRADHRIIRPDGSERLVQQRAKVITDNQGRAVRMVGTIQDITEVRHLEDQLRHSQKLEAVGRLAGGIAHDFNNVLTAINGYSDLTLERLPLQDSIRPNIEEIRRAGERAASLTQQLLAFSRKQVMQPRVINLNTILAEIDNMLRRLLGEDIQLQVRLAPDLGQLKADPGQIEQVILNLAVNARDAMPDGGQLTLETSNTTLDDEYARMHEAVVPGRYVLFTVTDSGCGMDSATQSRIFEPFFTTKEQGKGTGLGLATVYGIVQQSGGSVWVHSELGQGSTFKIYLPVCRDSAEAAGPASAGGRSLTGTETVLVVEDEPAVRTFVRLVLAGNDYHVLEATNGKQALEVSQHHPGEIQLMVADVVMPEMGGQRLAAKLAALRPRMKVLYLSGYTENAIVRHGILNSKSTFLRKPFTVEALLQKVRQALDEPLFRNAGG
jgi:PAS domain S-box-containing protein